MADKFQQLVDDEPPDLAQQAAKSTKEGSRRNTPKFDAKRAPQGKQDALSGGYDRLGGKDNDIDR